METRRQPPDPAARPARARAIDWSKAKAQGASAWAVAARETHASVDVSFRFAERDKRVAAGVLAGGIAYRFFFWFLSVALVAVGALGLDDSTRVESALHEVGRRFVAHRSRR